MRRLELRRDQARADRRAIVDRTKSEKRDELSTIETREFNGLTGEITGLEERIADIKSEIQRSGRGPGGYLERASLGGS